MTKLRTGLLITEAAACFALPAYLLFWGLITAPMWLFAAMRGGTYAIWTLVYALGGCLGIVGLVAFVRYVVSSDDGRKFGAIRRYVTPQFSHPRPTRMKRASILPSSPKLGAWSSTSETFSTV